MREIDSEEFSWWLAYSRIEPFGHEREDMGAAMVSSVLANVNRDSKKRPTPFTVKDFMFDFYTDPEEKRKQQRNNVGKQFKEFIKQWQS